MASVKSNAWPDITDVNERRKAQNRVAQKNYRTRQKVRMKLVEAVLSNMPSSHPALAAAAATNPLFADILPDNTAMAARAKLRTRSGSGGGGLPSIDFNTDVLCLPASPEQHMDTTDCCIDAQAVDWLDLGNHNHHQSPPSPARHSSSSSTDALFSSLPTGEGASSPGCCFPPPSPAKSDAEQARPSPPTCTPSTLSSSSSYSVPSPSSALISSASSAGEIPEKSASPESARRVIEYDSPFLTAVALGNLDIARLLIRSGANVDARDAAGRTSLHRAVDRGDVGTVLSLLKLGADMETKDGTGMTLLHTAVEQNNCDLVRLLLLWCEDHHGEPSSTSSSLSSENKRSLIRRWINALDDQRMTAVHLSVSLERIEILKVLLEYGADVNIGCR